GRELLRTHAEDSRVSRSDQPADATRRVEARSIAAAASRRDAGSGERGAAGTAAEQYRRAHQRLPRSAGKDVARLYGATSRRRGATRNIGSLGGAARRAAESARGRRCQSTALFSRLESRL